MLNISPIATAPRAARDRRRPSRFATGAVELLHTHGKAVATFTLGGIALGVLWPAFIAPSFTAQSLLYIPTPTPSGAMTLNDDDAHSADARPDQGARDAFLAAQCELITSSSLLQRVGANIPHADSMKTLAAFNGDVEKCLRENLTATVDDYGAALSVTTTGATPDEAVKLTRAVVDSYLSLRADNLQTTASGLGKSLRDQRDRALNDRRAIERAIEQFRADNPDFDPATAGLIAQRRVQMLSEQLTSAQMQSLQLQQLPAENLHRKAALSFETQISNALHNAQGEAAAINTKVAAMQTLEDALEEKRTFLTQLNARLRQVEMQHDAQAIANGATVIEPGRLVHESLAARPALALLVFSLIGLIGGSIFAFLRGLTDPMLRGSDDVSEFVRIPLLGVVPKMPRRRSAVARAMAVHLDPRGAAAESFRTVRTSILMHNRPMRSLLVTSPHGGDGRSVCATNLALALARAGRNVLLIDANFRKPAQQQFLDLREGSGLAESIRSASALGFAIQETGIDRLWALTAGTTPIDPSELADHPRLSALLGALVAKFDHVVIDGPALTGSAGAISLAALCDATVLVLRTEITTLRSARHTAKTLSTGGAFVVGAIVNAARVSDRNSIYGEEFYAPVETMLQERAGEPAAVDRV